MKTKLALTALAAFGGFVAFANSASAHPDIHVRVGIGFGTPAQVPYYAPAPVPYYAPAPVAYCAPAPVVFDHHYGRPTGYWKEVVVKTWVPASYAMSRDWHGRPVRVIEPAHFAYRTDRIWVNNRG